MAIKFLNTATAATQAVGDNSTKIATTAYADAAASAIPIGNYLPLSAGASKPLTGPLYIPHYIYHVGDAGTFIGFPANDRLIIGTNGGTRVDITNSGFCLGDSGSNISVSTILDENDMASDSATALVTQQSIKAYVDAQTPGAGVFLPLAGGTMNTNAAITMSGSLTTSANVYAQRFYDQGNNAFYGDFAGTSQFNHVKVNSVLGTRNFVAGSYGWQLEQSSTTGSPVTFRFDNQKYRVYAGGGAGEIMTFLEGGNIGIGTVSPGAKLNVAGDVLIDSGEYISWGTVGATSIEGSTASNKLQFRTSSTDRMIINDTGVGIGTTSPQQKLHVQGGGARVEDFGTGLGGFISVGNNTEAAGNYSAYFFGNTALDQTYFKGGIAYETLASTNGRGDMHFLQDSNANSSNATIADSVMTILNGGNVGIGTTSPGYKLEVNAGNGIFVGDGGAPVLEANSSTGLFKIGDTDELGDGVYLTNDTGGNLDMYSAGSIKVRMDVNGRFMIGTTTATSNANLTVKDSLAIQNGSNTVLSISTGYGSSFINTGTSGGTVNFGAPTSYTTNVYVQGTIKAASSVQMGNNTAAASAANAGSTRYRVSGNNSYMDMSMRTGSTTYAWVNIVQNNW